MSETIISKRCSKCKEIKPISEFYKRPEAKNGHRADCKICQNIVKEKYLKTEKGKRLDKISKRKYRQSKKGKIAFHRFHHSAKGKAAYKRYHQTENCKNIVKKYRFLHSEKWKAKNAVNNAVRAGIISVVKNMPCIYCSKPAEQYHHPSYAPEHWLDVVPVCSKCHFIVHQEVLAFNQL